MRYNDLAKYMSMDINGLKIRIHEADSSGVVVVKMRAAWASWAQFGALYVHPNSRPLVHFVTY